jgi:mono/diheme cytochrome c family protein
MSDERNTSATPTWGEEAQGIASKFAVGSGVAITFVLFGLIVVPSILRERQAPPRGPSDQPAGASLGWLDEAEAPPSEGKDLPPVDPKTVMTANPKLLAQGDKLFKQNCVSCHGDTGHGDGPAAGTLNPKPRDFSQSTGWKNGFRITDIFKTVTTGIKGTGMASFDSIRPADRMALVHYVRSLGKFDHGAEDAKASEELANQFRSKAFHIPNKIPVSMAMAKLLKEQPAAPALTLPADEDKRQGVELLRSAIVDPTQAARTLADASKLDRVAFARALAAGVPENGFSTALVAWGESDWQSVTSALQITAEPAPAPAAAPAPAPAAMPAPAGQEPSKQEVKQP